MPFIEHTNPVSNETLKRPLINNSCSSVGAVVPSEIPSRHWKGSGAGVVAAGTATAWSARCSWPGRRRGQTRSCHGHRDDAVAGVEVHSCHDHHGGGGGAVVGVADHSCRGRRDAVAAAEVRSSASCGVAAAVPSGGCCARCTDRSCSGGEGGR